MSCPKCPFLEPMSAERAAWLKGLIQKNYDTNYAGCRETWPKWRPGLCHSGGVTCAGYIPQKPMTPPRRLRILDIHTPWFWLTVFFEPEAYGEPWFRIDLWHPQSWLKWRMVRPWRWEDLPPTVNHEMIEIPQNVQDS